MVKQIIKDPTISATDLHRDKIINHNNVSLTCIKDCLIEEGYEARRMIKTHSISEKNKMARVEWCTDL